MGSVYEAYDPHLDRRVAIKVVHAERFSNRSDGGAGLRSQLAHEARALARLSHPNVVAVFDFGEHDHSAYIAMELVRGQTLSDWLTRHQASWPRLHSVLSGAARGLSAIHGAGLLHRDFKPDNVMVCDDGRVIVLDLGIALACGEDTPQRSALTDDGHPQTQQTQSGGTGATIAGTRPYMSPEQHRGEILDARSDQYSFCITVYRALFGDVPFDDRDPVSVLQAKQRCALDFDRKARVGHPKRRVQQLLRRGLDPDPARRYPSMRRLLDDWLELGPQSRAGRGFRWLGVAASGLAATIAMSAALQNTAPDACSQAAERIHAVWNQKREHELGEVFSRASRDFAYASEAWTRVRARMTRLSGVWLDTHHELCRAAARPSGALTLRGSQALLVDRQMICLDTSLAQLSALIDALATGDRSTITNAVEAGLKIEDPQSCAALDTVESGDQLPSSRDARARVAELQSELGRLYTELALGRALPALPRARQLVDDAEQLGHPATEVSAQLNLSYFLRELGQIQRSIEWLRTAEITGTRHDVVLGAADIPLALVFETGYRRSDRASADESLGWAKSKIERFGANDQILASYYQMRGLAAMITADFDESEAWNLETMHLLGEQAHGPFIALAWLNLGVVFGYQHRFDRAREYTQRAVDGFVRVLGELHPMTQHALGNLGWHEYGVGRPAAARRAFIRALRDCHANFGHDAPSCVHHEIQLLNYTSVALGRLQEDRSHAEHAMAVQAQYPQRSMPWVAWAQVPAARLWAADRRDLARAEELAREGLRSTRNERDFLPHLHIEAAWTLAEILLARGRVDEAWANIELGQKAARTKAAGNRVHVVALERVRGLAQLARGELESAYATLSAATESQRELFHPLHPTLLPFYRDLATSAEALGKREHLTRLQLAIRKIKARLAAATHSLRSSPAADAPESSVASGHSQWAH